MPARNEVLLVLAVLCLALTAAGPAHAEALWRLEQPNPPPGASFKVPLGPPGDLKFWAPNRGLLAVEGNSTIPRGLFWFNGETWQQLSTVCGGPGDTTRIAWAGPTEFWVVTEPSRPRLGSGIALCHFKDGEVAGSYSTAPQAADPYRQMSAASCTGPNDCWFGGVGAEDPTGQFRGAFHLHWDGTNLTTFYAPQGRAVTDIQAHAGGFFESTAVGPARESPDSPDLAEPETPKPRLLHRIAGGSVGAGPFAFTNEPFTFADRPGLPPDGTELLALDTDGANVWAGGGGAASGASAPPGGIVPRLPAVARFDGSGWQEPALDPGDFTTDERIVDIAARPGTGEAWAAVQPYAERRSVNAKATVALIDAGGAAEVTRLPVSGSGRGSAARIAFTGPDEGWMATYAGWLFHYTDGTPLPRDEDPAFQRLITFRPNEAAEQFVPDAPPADDSNIFAPPPLEVTQDPPAQPPVTIKVPALFKKPKTRLVNKTTLELRLTLARKAVIQLVAYRKVKGKKGAKSKETVVARTKRRSYTPGKVVLRLKLDPKKWPTRLAFRIKDSIAPSTDDSTGGGDGDTVATPPNNAGDTVTTR
jgi:hypothetical protein